MPAAIPMLVGAAVSAGAAAGVFGAFIAGSAFATALISGAASLLVGQVFAPKPKAPDQTAFLNQAGGGRTQQVRQPIAPHQIPFGRIKQSGPIAFIHTANDDGGKVNGYLYLIHGLAGCHVKSIDDIYLGDDYSSASQFSGLFRVGKHLGETTQVADAELVAEIPTAWTADHRLRGRAYTATRLKWSETAYPGGIPNVAAIVRGNDEIYDPR